MDTIRRECDFNQRNSSETKLHGISTISMFSLEQLWCDIIATNYALTHVQGILKTFKLWNGIVRV